MKEKKLVCGVGINDADYIVKRYEMMEGKRKIVWRCPYYERWCSMLKRCYSEKCQERQPTYKGCSVCEEWLTFSNFKRWMETQKWDNRALDKDFLLEGNKIYSPSTCVFLPIKLNSFIIIREKSRGLCPLGVYYKKKKGEGMKSEYIKPYISGVRDQKGGKVRLGHYSTPEEAHQAYLKAKLGYCIEYLQEFKDEPLILKGLTRIKNKLKYHIENGLELTSF